MLKVVRLSEKTRDVRRQRGNHAAALSRVIANGVAIVGEGANSERPKAFGKTRINERGFRFGQVNSSLSFHDIGDLAKIGSRKRKLAGD